MAFSLYHGSGKVVSECSLSVLLSGMLLCGLSLFSYLFVLISEELEASLTLGKCSTPELYFYRSIQTLLETRSH